MTTKSTSPTASNDLIELFLNSLEHNENKNQNERELLLGLSPPVTTMIESKNHLQFE